MGLRDWIGLVLQPKQHCSLRSLIQVEIEKNCQMVHELVGDCDHDCDNCVRGKAFVGSVNRQEPFSASLRQLELFDEFALQR